MSDNPHFSSNVYEWAAIKLLGGPEPSEERIMVVDGKTIIEYNADELPPLADIKAMMPSNELIALYNKYKHDIAFKKSDDQKKKESAQWQS